MFSSSIFSATFGSRSRLQTSSKATPGSPSTDSACLKTPSSVSVYAWNFSSASCSSDSRLTAVTFSVITPVSSAIIAKAVAMMYRMKNRVITGIRFATKRLMSPHLSKVTSWNIVIMLRGSDPKSNSMVLTSSISACGPEAHSSAFRPTTLVTMIPAMRTTKKKSTPIQKQATRECMNPCTSMYSCLKCLRRRHDRRIRTMRMMRKAVSAWPPLSPASRSCMAKSTRPASTTVRSKRFHARSSRSVKKWRPCPQRRREISAKKNSKKESSKMNHCDQCG
mmetsp:Transcript_23338/g.72689  ORF Transcript_23338/g.72689 Transcript_23338/m.72689 type:complete len:279 (-) Transcript_23338:393-1229(-)